VSVHDHGEFYKSPSFPFYGQRFAADVQVLEPDEVGAYILLICYAWEHQGIPRVLRRIASIGKMNARTVTRVWGALEAYWKDHPTCQHCLISPRLEEIRKEQAEHAALQSERGKSGARARWRKQTPGNAQALPMQCLEDGSPNSVYISSLRSEIAALDAWASPDSDEFQRIAEIFAAAFSGAKDPEKLASYRPHYSDTLAAMRGRGASPIDAWTAFEAAVRARSKPDKPPKPLWGGAKAALNYLPPRSSRNGEHRESGKAIAKRYQEAQGL